MKRSTGDAMAELENGHRTEVGLFELALPSRTRRQPDLRPDEAAPAGIVREQYLTCDIPLDATPYTQWFEDLRGVLLARHPDFLNEYLASHRLITTPADRPSCALFRFALNLRKSGHLRTNGPRTRPTWPVFDIPADAERYLNRLLKNRRDVLEALPYTTEFQDCRNKYNGFAHDHGYGFVDAHEFWLIVLRYSKRLRVSRQNHSELRVDQHA
jgi:hypothetical protein